MGCKTNTESESYSLSGKAQEIDNINSALSSHLAFLQQVPEMQYYICETNLVPAADVADLLEANAVRTVILNACRSARGSSLESSIIGAFLRRGVEHVAAMNYMIISLSVQIFTACVYRCLMQQGASLASAVHFARKIMKSSTERVSRIGTTVNIDDFVVPLIFEASIAGDKNHGIVECDIQSLADLDFSPTYPFGREDDIRQIEDALLIGRRPLLLTGIAGVGKSSLVQHLRSWWKNTGLIRDFVIVSLNNVETEFCVDAIKLKLQLHLVGDLTSKADHAALVDYLRSHRFLVVIDSLESAEAEDLRLERIKLRSFLKELCGGLTIVIIVSRSKETSLSGETITHELGGLSIMAGLQWIQRIIRASQTILNVPSWDREEDIQYFEQIIKLVDGHPLALQMLVSDFQCKLNKSPKDYFYSDLLGGSHIIINRMEYKEKRKYRSLREIDALITAWEEISQRGQSFHPVVLSPFWRVLSEREFSQYLKIQCLLQKNAFGSTKRERISNFVQFLEPLLPNIDNPVLRAVFETIKQSGSSIQENSDDEDPYGMRESAFLISEDVEIPALPPQMQSMFDECTSTVLESFSESQFLQPVKRNAVHPALRPKKYLRVHPLLTIMLRAEPGYEQNFMNIRLVCQKALMQYCCWRIKKWPWTYNYWNEVWDVPRAESGLDFMNLAASVQHMIDLGMESAIEQAAACQLVTALQRGAPADSSRIRILMVLWEKLLTVALKDSKRFGGEAAAHPPGLSSSSSSPVMREKPRSDIAAIRLRCSVVLVFLLACNLYMLHRHLKSGRAEEFLKVSRETHAMINALPPPADVPESQHELMMLGFDNMLAQVTRSNDSRTLDVPEMWKLHEKYVRTSIDHYGVEEYPENRKTWHDIPLSINSSSEFVARFTSHSRQIRQAIDERRYADAKSSIGEAILVEINDAGNHAKNLSTLYMYLSEVNEAQGDWQDALDNFEVACRYQDQLREAPMSFEDAMTRELQREFLLQKLG